MPEHSRKTILLVEDEALIALNEKRQLEKAGYAVIHATSGERAIEAVAGAGVSVDLVLMDIELGPGMDGAEAASKISGTQDVPVLFLSSHTDTDIVQKTEAVANYGYVVKDPGFAVLDASIKRAFRLSAEKRNADRRIEDVLRSREHEYRSTVESLLAGVIVHDADSRILISNPEASRILGLSSDQMTGKDAVDPAWMFVHEDMSPMKVEDYPVSRAIASRQPLKDCVLGIRRPDRDYVTWITFNAQPIFDAAGAIEKVIVNFIDITARKQADAELKAANRELLESEKRLAASGEVVRNKLRALLEPEGDAGALGLSDILDTETMQSLMNDLYAITGIGIGIIDCDGKVLVATGWQDICVKYHRGHPETLKNCIDSDLVLSAGVPAGTFKAYRCKNNMWDISTPIILAGRHVGNIFLGQFLYEDEQPDLALFREQAAKYGFDEEGYLDALDKVPRWSRDKVDRAIRLYSRLAVMISNLSYSTIKLSSALAQKSLAENALKESDFFIKSLLQSLPLPVYYKDAQGRYAGCNHAFESFVGKTSDEILGKTVFDINPADLASIYYDKDAELLSSPCRQIYESQARNASGELRNVIFHKASLTDASGAVSGIVGAMLDITELKLSEEKIRTLLGEKELILKEVHHRIKNYMNTVYGLLFLQSQSQDSPEATATLLDAADRVKSMLRLYDRLYRSEDDGELSLGQYLSSLVDEVISIFPRSRPVRVSASIDDVVLSAKVLSPLSIIVNELVTNSMKYAIKDRDEGAIAITVARNGGSMRMTYEDDGPGLPADFSFEGSPGFGMQLIQMLVLQMRGNIAIDQAKRSRIVMEIPER